MEEKPFLKGQLLIRSIIEEYRNILETFEDPQVLGKEDTSYSELSKARSATPEALKKLSLLFCQLKECYNSCLPDCPFEFKENISKECSGENDLQDIETSNDLKDMQRRNDQLKNIINETRQLIWDIDKLKSH